jgi:hypothetical protein
VTYDSPARLTWKSIVRERCADNIVHRFTTFQE